MKCEKGYVSCAVNTFVMAQL